jgi:ParB family transcriptional regulator, chromosome partitioning protein
MARAGSPKSPRAGKVRRGVAATAERRPSVADLREIQVDQIQVPGHPARRFLGDIPSLAASMDEYGLQQPISVRADGDKYILTSGLRRLTAAQMLGWTSIPAFVRSMSADDAYVIDLVENLQREDLSAEEEADALGELVRTRGWTLDQVAEAVKRSPGYVSKRVRLFQDAELRDAVVNHGMPVSTAELLLGAAAAQRSALLKRALAEQWDQMRIRDALQSAQERLTDAGQPHKIAARGRGMDTVQATSRPAGFTRVIREFYRTILTIRTEELTPADRAALRTLFKALVELARAQTTPGPKVFPPLPSSAGGRARTRAAGSRAARKR